MVRYSIKADGYDMIFEMYSTITITITMTMTMTTTVTMTMNADSWRKQAERCL